MEKTVKKKVKIAIIIVAAVILLALIGAFISMAFSYSIQSLVIKVACNEKNPSTPSNYDEILSQTTLLAEDLSYESEYPDGYLDIIAPVGVDTPLPLVLYIHGGYYAGGDKKTKEPYCRVVASNGYIVANMNYVLTPEEKYPTQLYQANEALAFLVKNSGEYNIDATRIFIGGDSAGGHLSGMLGAYYTNDELAAKIGSTRAIGKQELKGVLLLCGFHNASKANEDYFFLLPSAMWMLTGVKDYQSYDRIAELNTVDNVTVDYPATYLTCGDKDPFYRQNQAMAAKLEEQGVYNVAYLPESTDKKLKHEFQCDFDLKECDTAMQLLVAFLSRQSQLD